MSHSEREDRNVVRQFMEEHRRTEKMREEARLLANRIALLQKEEEKANKMIVSTKNRAREIVRMREETERRMQEQMEAKQREQEEREATRKKMLEIEQKGRKARSQHMNRLHKKKQEDVEVLRREKIQHQRKVKSREAALVQRNRFGYTLMMIVFFLY